MSEWDANVQRIIDLVERNLRGELTLGDVSRRLGYSPWYCTRQFSRVVGMSLRSYLRLRRLSEAVVALRDGDRGILDVAVEFGFSSQEAFSRAFKAAWGTAPGAWRSHPRPLELVTRRNAAPLTNEGGSMKAEQKIQKIEIGIQAVPARRFIGIKSEGAADYCDFWAKVERSGEDCHRIEGILASVTANAQIGGWYEENGRKGYLYGVEVPADYAGPVPRGDDDDGCARDRVRGVPPPALRFRQPGRGGLEGHPRRPSRRTTPARRGTSGIPRSRRGSATIRPAWARPGAGR